MLILFNLKYIMEHTTEKQPVQNNIILYCLYLGYIIEYILHYANYNFSSRKYRTNIYTNKVKHEQLSVNLDYHGIVGSIYTRSIIINFQQPVFGMNI